MLDRLLAQNIQSTVHFRLQEAHFFVQDPAAGRPVPTGESRLGGRGADPAIFQGLKPPPRRQAQLKGYQIVFSIHVLDSVSL